MKEILTSMEVIQYLRITRVTLYRLMKRKQIKGRKVGRNYRFLKEDIDRFMREEK